MKPILFGPITSRRFGTSLGIDLSPNIKQCNFDCLYCELEGKRAIEKMEDIISVDSILQALQNTSLDSIDVLTITANGEPTLYPHLYELIQKIKTIIPQKTKTLILSNGSRFGESCVQKALLLFDKVKFSLDGGNQKIFSRIDRPHKNLMLQNITEGIRNFSKIYQGELFAEILFIKNINDKQENLDNLINFFKDLKLARIDLSTIDRPPAYTTTPLSFEELELIAKFLQKELPHIPISIPKRKAPLQDAQYLEKEELFNLIARRPIEATEAQKIFTKDTLSHLTALLNEKRIFLQKVDQLFFYTTKNI
ncbi:radical SAM protein [Helicobacter anatolicus]|uniref:radical SAM protein n=1 Tax=Helicobacter anatolicus TaxID=2905874 RepID=UPI001E4A4CD8|nr:radical SAM protein [Helicobacter anatolicus]MCE3038042.1 radical SAM protein [Helicobacter anatolicus]